MLLKTKPKNQNTKARSLFVAMLLAFLVILLSSSSYVSSQEPLRVYVDSAKGKDCPDCLSSRPIVCSSLVCVSQNLTQTKSVEIVIVGDLLNLSTPIQFSGFTDLKVTSVGKRATILCNESSAGLAFLCVNNLTIESLIFEKCGAPRDSTSVNVDNSARMADLNVAVYILNCTDVFIDGVVIVDSNGTGLSLYDTNGTVRITDSIFSHNTAGRYKTAEGGGGLHIEFTICTPGVVRDCSGHKGRNKNSNYAISNCTFSNNTAYTRRKNIFISPSPYQALPTLGKGGGVYLSIASYSAYNTFTVDNCTFQYNSASFGGGGILSEYLHSVQNNAIIFKHVTFLDNTCLQQDVSNGAGLVMSALFYAKSLLHGNNSFSCSYCNFTNNSAYFGGGTAIYATKDVSNASLTRIDFHMCSWTGNTAATGAALFVSPALWDFTRDGFLPTPQLTDCVFISNSGVQGFPSLGTHIKVLSSGYGAVLSNEFKLIFGNSTTFSFNKGSALYLTNSAVECLDGCNVTFYNNTAKNGGAIVMHGSSVIRVTDNSKFSFINNFARSRGGAIYIKFSVALQPAYRNCFVQSQTAYKKSNASFTFTDNTAGRNGTSIFANTFRMCEVLCSNSGLTPYNPKTALMCVADFSFNDTDGGIPLATLPSKYALETKSPIELFPGTEHYIPLLAIDESNTTLKWIVYDAAILPSNSSIQLDPAFSQISNNTVNVLGQPGERAKLSLGVSDVLLTVDIQLTDCQPGYILRGSKCDYASSQYLGLVPCRTGVCLKQGYWMGYCSENTQELCTASCPEGYCSYKEMEPHSAIHPLPNRSAALDRSVCGQYRTGRLCSKCVNGRSVFFHSREAICGPEDFCHLGLLFYLLSEIIPVTVLFAIVVFFNIRFTSGTINCFIFYAQVLDAIAANGKDTIQYPASINFFNGAIMFVYHPLNLDFFTLNKLSFCLWKGSSVMSVLMMKYVTVAFALLLVLVTILLAKWRYAWVKIFARFETRESVLIHGLTAFLVLCYSQTVRVTFHILTYFCLYSSKFHCSAKVVFPAAYLQYFQGDHVKYAIVALVVLVTVVILPPLLLLIYPLIFRLLSLCRLSESKGAILIWRMIPIQFLDAYQSSFRNKYRFFAGLYFFYRAAVFSVYMATVTLFQFYCLLEILLIAVLCVHAVFQPYKKRAHNTIDILLLTNLCIINVITLYNHTLIQLEEHHIPSLLVNAMGMFQKILMVLPLFCLVAAKLEKQRRKCKNKRKDYENLPSLRSE